MAPASSIPGAGLRVWGFGVLGFRVWDLEFRSFEHSWAWPALRLKPQSRALLGLRLGFRLTGPKPKKIKVETFRIDYLVRTPKVKKLSLQPIRRRVYDPEGLAGLKAWGKEKASEGEFWSSRPRRTQN